jgi:hypothetical protein
LIWTAWNNGSYLLTGAGYGLKVPIADRDTHFDPSWKYIKLDLPSDAGTRTIQINVDKPSFWDRTCRELISKEIGQWLIKSGLALWKKGKPPKFEVAVAGRAHFRLKAVYSR